eukprot:TRINITY_DN53017_c0_g1_i1.p1 TRINITY_DN53017_c0_g1~~TRINITY_DN53017_c0_g1_i1.p1  ORF type:complete len:189 (+),score=49.98 TRINITY_DN53017_c0_g1_i1:62-628(+)
MTTAHRPTFSAARATDTPGGNRLSVGSQHLAARNLPGELTLKYRGDLKGGRAAVPQDSKKEQKPTEKLEAMKRDADVALESSDDESEDSEAELQRELQRVQKERQAAAQRKQEADAEKKRKEAEEEALTSNPLMDLSGSGGDQTTKRRWDDDVLFKNQAYDEPEHKRRFINDTIRNDFHRKFLERYMK